MVEDYPKHSQNAACIPLFAAFSQSETLKTTYIYPAIREGMMKIMFT